MKKAFLFTSAVTLILLLVACGGSSNNNTTPPPPPPVSVSLTETAVTMDTSPDINVSNTHTFKAVVQNASNTAVTWKVNGIVGGDTYYGHGTISAAGVYTAPVFIPSDSITVTATSLQDPKKSASATVKLNWYVASINVGTNGGDTQVKTNEQLQVNSFVSTYGPQSVSWDVNGMRVGSATLGALFFNPNWPGSVFYTAPSLSPGTVTLTATSDANSTKSASVQITVLNADPSEPSISISPADVTLELGKVQQFSANVNNSSYPPQWSLTSAESRLANGFLKDGLYTAPFEMPSVPDVLVTASINGYRTKYGYAVIHVAQPTVNPTARIHGNYVIALQDHTFGTDILGVITADGNGNLQGTADLNTRFGAAPSQTFTGTYFLGADGRGQATITYNPLPGANATLSARIMMVSDDFAYLYATDTYFGSSLGVLEKQSSASFSNASLMGNYAFLLRGVGTTTAPPPTQYQTIATATAGILTASGDGTLTGNSDNSIGGTLTQQALSGTYSIRTDGTGTATLNLPPNLQQTTSHLSLAMVSPAKFYILTTDDVSSVSAFEPLLAGSAELQSGTFSKASLSGPYVAYDRSYAWMQLLRFDSSGTGTLSHGITDERTYNGIDPVSVDVGVPFTGSYSIDSTGRGQLDVTASNGSGSAYIYMISPSKFFLLLNESPDPATGEGYAQALDPSGFDYSTLDGRYAVEISNPLYDGVGWIYPYYSMSWMGWIDYSGYIRSESEFDFNPADTYGTGQLFMGLGNGTSIGPMRYHPVSNSKVLMMSVFQGGEGNVLVFMNKLEE